ncbi:hypothetical protein LguiA_036404 [Lonicera macranthoides]
MATTTTTGGRDARRKRLTERGTDRLALITGRIQTLPSPTPETAHHSHTASCPPHLYDNLDPTPFSISSSSSSVFVPSETKDCIPPLPKHDSGIDDSKSQEGPFMRSRTQVSRAYASDSDDKVPSFPFSSSVQNPSSVSTVVPEQKLEQPASCKIFTPSQIIYAIAVSEKTRICFSLLAAILVVLSYIGFPIVSSFVVKSVLLLRPLSLVLMTNITIVLAHILLEKWSGPDRVEREVSGEGSDGGSDLADQVGMALESGFVLQNIASAVFTDSSVFAVVVICGLSLAQSLGW